MTKKQIIWTIVVVVALLIIFRKKIAKMLVMNGEKQPGVKCCTERDANCQCTKYEYKKSEDCQAVPCPEIQRVVVNKYPSGIPTPAGANGINTGTGGYDGGNGGGRPVPSGTIA